MYREMGAGVWVAYHDALAVLGYLLLGLVSVAFKPLLTLLVLCIFCGIIVWRLR